MERDTGVLSLLKELDREEVDTHTLVVFVTNHMDEQQAQPDENSKLTITIKVMVFICLFLARQPQLGQGLLIHEVSRSHTTAHHIR